MGRTLVRGSMLLLGELDGGGVRWGRDDGERVALSG